MADYWRDVQQRRRTRYGDVDPMTLERLIAHDVENTLGVAMARGDERNETLGYRSWFVSLDFAAYDAVREMNRRLGARTTVAGVAMSPDFLATYLTMGPNRQKLVAGKNLLPVMTDLVVIQAVPKELLQIASGIRDELRVLSERVRRRRVRDAVDMMRRKTGELASGGVNAIEERIKQILLDRVDSSPK